jgi:hypothetical protein
MPVVTVLVGRNAARAGRSQVPDVGMSATMARLERPGLQHGFDAVMAVSFSAGGGFEVCPAEREQAGGR